MDSEAISPTPRPMPMPMPMPMPSPVASTSVAMGPAPVGSGVADKPRRFYRHRLPVRLMHWVNVVCMTVLLMSGLNIFNAHPELYWGQDSSTKPWFSLLARDTPTGPVGRAQIGDYEIATTGVLGLSKVDGQPTARGFPSWATIPGGQWLAMARHWHLFFAWLFVINGVAYVLWTIVTRHLSRDLVPTKFELKHIGRSIVDHLKFRHPTGEAARRYNVLQSLTYLIVIFVLLPLIVLAGMALSPRIDSVVTGWLDLFGGRQSARSVHFLAAMGLLLFVVIHVVEVFLAGVWNEIRSMVTGWYVLPVDHAEKKAQR